MKEILAALILAVCMASGALLRYSPFRSLVSQEKKRRLFFISATVSIANLVLMIILFRKYGLAIAFRYLRLGGIVYAVVLSCVKLSIIRGRVREHLFVMGIVLTGHYLLLSVPSYLLTLIGHLPEDTRTLLALAVYSVLLILLNTLLRRGLQNTIEPFLKIDSGEYWHTVWFIPLLFFGAMVLSVLSSSGVETGSIMQVLSSILSGSMMVLICASVSAGHRRLMDREAINQQLEHQKVHYAELRVRVEDARKTRHDFKHHVAAIRHYMDIDDKEGLRAYCDQLVESTEGKNKMPYTGNAAADGVIYHYMQQAHKKEIQFTYAGVIRNPGISDLDISVLLGNSLDNALAGCMTVQEDRAIQVVCQSEKQMLSILVRNRFDGIVNNSDEGLRSRKRENRTGVGLKSMKDIIERYGGVLNTQWDDSHFTVTMIIPTTEES